MSENKLYYFKRTEKFVGPRRTDFKPITENIPVYWNKKTNRWVKTPKAATLFTENEIMLIDGYALVQNKSQNYLYGWRQE